MIRLGMMVGMRRFWTRKGGRHCLPGSSNAPARDDVRGLTEDAETTAIVETAPSVPVSADERWNTGDDWTSLGQWLADITQRSNDLDRRRAELHTESEELAGELERAQRALQDLSARERGERPLSDAERTRRISWNRSTGALSALSVGVDCPGETCEMFRNAVVHTHYADGATTVWERG